MKKRNKQIALAIITGIIFLTCTNPFFPGTVVPDTADSDTAGPDAPGPVSQPDAPRVLKTYTVKFYCRLHNEDIEDLHLTEGAKIPKLPVMTDDENKSAFGGWYTKSDPSNGTPNSYHPGGKEWDFAKDTVNDNITLYAKWDLISDVDTYTVIFNANGHGTPPDPQTLVLGALVVEPPPMTATGYAFGGWYMELGFINECNFATFRGTGGEGETYLYAKWYDISDPNVTICTVIFNTNIPAVTVTPQTVVKGGKVVEPVGNVMKQDGFSFRGWYTDNGALWNFATNTVSGNMTLHAEWSVIYYTVVFDMAPRGNDPAMPDVRIYGGGDQRPPTQTIAYGGYIDEPNGMTINNMALGGGNGYGFDGWYIANDKPWAFKGAGTTGQVGKYNPATASANIMGTTTITLYPRWRKDETFTGGGIAVWARDGSFTMGNNSVSGSKPAHDVTVTGFYISSYLVTQKQYIAVMDYNPSKNEIGDNYPVVGVTWLDAVKYCNALSTSEGLTPVYNKVSDSTVTINWAAAGYRLPTEAEWEYAARGGNGSPGNYEWAGSNTPTEVAWFSGTGGNSGGKTQIVGQKKPNILRTYDMSGNACEWCWDKFDAGYYKTCLDDPATYGKDPKGVGAEANTATINASMPRVRRGGSWNHGSANTRTFIRDSYDPTAKDVWTIGFRVVRRAQQ